MALTLGSATNQDGRSATLTAPNGASQAQVIKMGTRDWNGNIDMIDIACIHGTGTALGDPIEVGSLQLSCARRRGSNMRPLPCNSIKSSTGHLEPAAGLVNIIRIMYEMHTSTLRPNVHLRVLSPNIDLTYDMSWTTEVQTLPQQSTVAITSAFGFGGTNGHAQFWSNATSGRFKWHNKVHISKLSYFSLSCSKCCGPMCHNCGEALLRVQLSNEHRCSAIREDGASYDICSLCYDQVGDYLCGQASLSFASGEVETVTGEEVSLVGTWNAWSKPQPMRNDASGKYVGKVTLRDNRIEAFRLLVGNDRKRAFYPAASEGASMRIMGPDEFAEGRHWVIDGVQDGSSAGAVYEVTFHWGEHQKIVDWAPVHRSTAAGSTDLASTADIQGVRLQHEIYSLFGSFKHGEKMLDMVKVGGDPFHWEATIRIGARRVESFRIACDHDLALIIHPEETTDRSRACPVVGPDASGLAKSWKVQGRHGEMIRVELHITPGHLTVSAKSLSQSTEWEWHSA
eukprot:gnl/TRDRNA2_/TRDRNA2_136511_c2_seq1.p1 gnl/TRDRNA2_/TRDRNA2_136511_c2~~gnl/TRDRNA2_/TRDRNA2_136511_c2_seq1.p1  ORF type:complete len:512 (+),score=44.92 gnl/TRDRNA2_/TRDRNA2_136511_c2_seq1:1-1536(+)